MERERERERCDSGVRGMKRRKCNHCIAKESEERIGRKNKRVVPSKTLT